MEEVCEICMIPRKTVHHHLAIILKKVLSDLKLKYKPITATQLVYKFGIDLDIPLEAQKKAYDILIKALQNGLIGCGKDPRGIAASAIYLSAKNCKCRKTQEEITKVAGISQITLRKRMKQIKSCLKNINYF